MRMWKRTACVAAVLASIICLATVWVYTAGARGRLKAHFDVRQGHYVVLAYGLPPGWRPEYARLLQQRYGIEVRTVAFCIVSENLRLYADSYNQVSIAAAKQKFGHDVFEECYETASKNWEIQKAARLAHE